MFLNPQLAYKAGYALAEPFMKEDQDRILRHVEESGVGTVYVVPSAALALEVLVVSAGHGEIYGAPLTDVEFFATAKQRLQ